MNPKIIHSDDAIVVVEKPAGMPSCHRSANSQEDGTLEGWLHKKFPGAKLVHRLDNETSGLMVAVKDPGLYKKMRAIWKTSEVIKKYTALVIGTIVQDGEIDTPIAHHPQKKKKMQVGGDGARPASTRFTIVKHLENYTLVEVEITTGVRHQIRAHLASIGHPIAGDKIYRKIRHREMDTLELNRHFLHLSYLEFKHPFDKKICKFHSEIPKEFQNLINTHLEPYI